MLQQEPRGEGRAQCLQGRLGDIGESKVCTITYSFSHELGNLARAILGFGHHHFIGFLYIQVRI